jgi:chromosome segregation ATPase
LRDENERHKNEVASLQKQINNLTRDAKNHNDLAQELEAEITSLNEELRAAKRTESSLNDEINLIQQRNVSGGRDSELLRKLQAENREFKLQISSLQSKLDTVNAQKDRVTRELASIQSQLDHTRAETENFGSIRAERDDLRKTTMAAQINVAKLRAQVNDLTGRGGDQGVAVIIQERDSLQKEVTTLRSQLEDAKRQAEVHMTRLRTAERNLADTKEDLEKERARAKNLLGLQTSSPNSDRTRRLNAEVRRLEDLLQQSRLRQAELGKINAAQLDEIDLLNRRIERLDGELGVGAPAHSSELHKQLTLAKGQLAEVRAQLAAKERELERRAGDQVDGNNKNLAQELQSVKKQLDLVREDAEQKEAKSHKHIRKLQHELDDLRAEADSLVNNLERSKMETQRHQTQIQSLRTQLQTSRDMLKRLKTRAGDEHGPSALTTQVEKRHGAELKGLGKQIRYLKARLFREESFRLDLQFAKKFFLMQVGCFESW